MLPTERHRLILNILDTQISATVRYLQEQLGVNAMALWRDLKLLEEQGLLKRVRGGAMSAGVNREPRFDAKLESARTAKTRIAVYTAKHFVQDGDIIALEGGTTVANLVPCLKNRNLTVLTNSLPVLNHVRTQTPQIATYCSGGFLREESGTLIGKEAITFFSRHKAGTFFMSATGLDLEAGISDPNPQEIEVKQAMAQAAERIVLMLDSSKLGMRSLMQILPLRKIDLVICDTVPPPSYAPLFKKNKIQLLIPDS